MGEERGGSQDQRYEDCGLRKRRSEDLTLKSCGRTRERTGGEGEDRRGSENAKAPPRKTRNDHRKNLPKPLSEDKGHSGRLPEDENSTIPKIWPVRVAVEGTSSFVHLLGLLDLHSKGERPRVKKIQISV